MASMAVEHVPLDMVGEILSWLPVRSVLRFRSVSKLWNSLTPEDYFIYSHVERSKSKPPQIVLHAADDIFQLWKGKLALVETEEPRWRRSSRKPAVCNVYILRGHCESGDVWDRIVYKQEDPPGALNRFSSCPDDLRDFFCGLSFVGDEGVSAWTLLSLYFCRDSRWSHIYRPHSNYCPQRVYGLYAFQESLVPLEKSAMLYEAEFRCGRYEFRHARDTSIIVPV